MLPPSLWWLSCAAGVWSPLDQLNLFAWECSLKVTGPSPKSQQGQCHQTRVGWKGSRCAWLPRPAGHVGATSRQDTATNEWWGLCLLHRLLLPAMVLACRSTSWERCAAWPTSIGEPICCRAPADVPLTLSTASLPTAPTPPLSLPCPRACSKAQHGRPRGKPGSATLGPHRRRL